MANKAETFWTKLFGIKAGDKVRLKYGKVTWTVYAIFPHLNLMKLIRYRRLGSIGHSSSTFSVMKTIHMNEEVRKVG